MISWIWSESKPLESRACEKADPRVNVSARWSGAQVTLSGCSVGSNRGDGGNVTARDRPKIARVKAATMEDPRADSFRRPTPFRFAPMRVPPRLPAMGRSDSAQGLCIGKIHCDPVRILVFSPKLLDLQARKALAPPGSDRW